jgi:hypothetical protein
MSDSTMYVTGQHIREARETASDGDEDESLGEGADPVVAGAGDIVSDMGAIAQRGAEHAIPNGLASGHVHERDLIPSRGGDRREQEQDHCSEGQEELKEGNVSKYRQ